MNGIRGFKIQYGVIPYNVLEKDFSSNLIVPNVNQSRFCFLANVIKFTLYSPFMITFGINSL